MRGLREDLRRANRDIKEGFEEVGVAGEVEFYDPKFITDLIEAEYADFVAEFKKHMFETSAMIDDELHGLAMGAKSMGLAQMS